MQGAAGEAWATSFRAVSREVIVSSVAPSSRALGGSVCLAATYRQHTARVLPGLC